MKNIVASIEIGQDFGRGWIDRIQEAADSILVGTGKCSGGTEPEIGIAVPKQSPAGRV